MLARPDSALYRARRFVRRHWLAVGAAGAVSAALVAGGGVALLQARQAQAERMQAEGLLEYMLGDLRGQLEPLGQLAMLDGVARRAQAYYAGQPLSQLDDTGLKRRSEALHMLARIAQERGHGDEMARLAAQAQAGSQLLLHRQPGSRGALLLSAASATVAADAAEMNGQFEPGEQLYLQAMRWAEQALALQPEEADARLALADVQARLAAFYADRGGSAMPKALALFESEHQTLLALVPTHQRLWHDISTNRSWVADTLFGLGRYEAALPALQQQREALSRLPGLADKPAAQWDSVGALNREAGVLRALGRLEAAAAASAQSAKLGTALVASDPQNADWATLNAIYLAQYAGTLVALDRAPDALLQLQTAQRQLLDIKPAAEGESEQLQEAWLFVLAPLAHLQPQDTTLFNRVRERMDAELRRPDPATRSDFMARTVARGSLFLGQLWARKGNLPAAQQAWQTGLQVLNSHPAASGEPLPMRVDLLLALGRRDEARAEVRAVRANGWRGALPET